MIYVDLHSLLLGIRKNGDRFPRVPKNWDAFLDADDVQMNEKEWELVAGMPFSRKNLVKFCQKWKRRNWETITVTLADKGAISVFRPGPFYTFSVRAPRIRNAEPTGAGDFFAAGYIAEALNLENQNAFDLTRCAVKAASWKCRYEGIEAVLKHRQGLKHILTTGKSHSKLRIR